MTPGKGSGHASTIPHCRPCCPVPSPVRSRTPSGYRAPCKATARTPPEPRPPWFSLALYRFEDGRRRASPTIANGHGSTAVSDRRREASGGPLSATPDQPQDALRSRDGRRASFRAQRRFAYVRYHRIYRQTSRQGHPHRGAQTPGVPRIRFRRNRHRAGWRPAGAPPQGQGRKPRAHRRSFRFHGNLRHRPHALGDARPPQRGQRASPCVVRRPHRGGAQRYRRELRRAARGAGRARPSFQKRHRHRGVRSSHRGGDSSP